MYDAADALMRRDDVTSEWKIKSRYTVVAAQLKWLRSMAKQHNSQTPEYI